MKVVLILPTYNERGNIIVLLDKLIRVSRGIKNHSIEYLVVDDTSPDGTKDAVFEYAKKNPSVHCIVGKKEGLGKAILRGLHYALDTMKVECIVQMDADLSHDPLVVPKLLDAIDHGSDFAVGSRYIPGGSIPSNWGIHRKIFSIFGNALVRYGLGYPQVHDWTGGFRAYKITYPKKLFAELTLYNGYVFQIAFLHKSILLGAHISEVPIHFSDRKYGRSKIAPSEYIRNVLEYVFRVRINSIIHGSFGKFLVVGGIGFIINALILVVLHDWMKISASIANIIGALIAIFSNFNLNNLWTFKKQSISGFNQYLIKLIHFYGTSLFGVLAIQTGTIYFGVSVLGDKFYFMYFLAGTALLLIWNYFVYSRFIWKKRN